MTLCSRPTTLSQNVMYFSVCLLLASQSFFDNEIWRHAVAATALVVFAATAAVMLMLRTGKRF